MGETKKDWKTAVDPRTGKTYWYHRKTRETTWIQPNFIEEEARNQISFQPSQEDLLNIKALRELHSTLKNLKQESLTVEFDQSLLNSLCAYAMIGSVELALNWSLYLICCFLNIERVSEIFALDIKYFVSLFDKIESFGFTGQVLIYHISLNLQRAGFKFVDSIVCGLFPKFEKQLSHALPFRSFSSEILEHILRECDFQLLTKIGCEGDVASSVLLLLYARSSCRNEFLEIALSRSVVTSVYAVGVSVNTTQVVASAAKEVVKYFISNSAYCQEIILDACFGFSRDVNSLSSNDTSSPVAPVLDVEWIPINGSSWKLQSAFLWARCPGLRDLIQEFWDQKSGLLEISIETDAEILGGICSYLHTGFLSFPDELPKLFELYHVVQELQILDLLLAIEKFLELKYRMDQSRSEILRLSELFGCRERLRIGPHLFPVETRTDELDTAINESLADVNSILNFESDVGLVTLNDVAKWDLPREGGFQQFHGPSGVTQTLESDLPVPPVSQKKKASLPASKAHPREFTSDMSLLPLPKKSENEKRLDEMAAPKIPGREVERKPSTAKKAGDTVPKPKKRNSEVQESTIPNSTVITAPENGCSPTVQSSLSLLKTKAMKIRSARVQLRTQDSSEFGGSKTERVQEENQSDVDSDVMVDFSPPAIAKNPLERNNFDESSNNDFIQQGEAEMYPCPECGRFFAEEPFQRHTRICKKVFVSKRKVFDSSKKRVEAIPELKEFRDHGRQRETKRESARPQRWREQSNAFRMAMRAARGYSSNQDVPNDPPIIDSSLKQCPNCLRRFNENAAIRHIPLCKNIVNKPVTLRRGGGMNASQGLTKKT